MKRITIALLFTAAATSCATPKPAGPSAGADAASGACRTEIETNGVKGLVRHVPGSPSRELWDVDGDGAVDFELRHIVEDGRIAQIERVTPDGVVVERIRREWNGNLLTSEVGDVFDAKGNPVADGTPDWRRDLRYEDGRLVEERIDQRDAAMLPGIDGTPEFRVVWEHQDGRPVSGIRYRDERPVATVSNVWEGESLVEVRTDFGADETVDRVERLSYDAQGRLLRSASEGTEGTRTLTYGYCE